MNRHDLSGAAPGACPLALEHEVLGTGDPVLLIAGANDTRRGWDMAVPALVDDFSCLVFDNRDAGPSPRAEAGPAAGHCCTAEAPEPVNAALCAFLLRS